MIPKVLSNTQICCKVYVGNAGVIALDNAALIIVLINTGDEKVLAEH